MRLAAAITAAFLSACSVQASEAKDGLTPLGKADAICDYNWAGSSSEGACPETWIGTDDGCDCGCQVPDPDCHDNTAALADTHVLVGVEPASWADISEAEFRRSAVPPPFSVGEPPAIGEPEYAIVERLQPVLDSAFDRAIDILRALNPGEQVAIPRPALRIVPALEANGWVGGVPVCLPTRVSIGPGDPSRPARETGQIILMADRLSDRMPGRGFGSWRRPEPCIRPDWSDDIAAYVAYWNSLGGACTLRQDGDGVRIEGVDCAYRGTATRSQTVVVLATAPFVNLTSEFLARAESEEQVLVTLFHELGHYVLAHPLTALSQRSYGHWYRQREHPSRQRLAVSDSAQLTARLTELEPLAIPHIPGARHSARLSRLLARGLGDLLTRACDGGCVCSEAVAELDGSWSGELSCLGCSSVPEAVESAYLRYESALDACAATMSVSATEESGALFASDLQQAIDRRGLGGDFVPPAGTALADWLQALDRSVAAQDSELEELLREISDRHLGLYTAEQHADEFSLEMWAAIGLEPEEHARAELGLAGMRNAMDPHAFLRTNGLSFSQLEMLFHSGWRGPSGDYVFVQLGNLHDSHHGAAYRVFNVSRDRLAHGHTRVGTAAERPHDWSRIQALARDLRARVPPPRPSALRPPDPSDPTVVDGQPPIIVD